MSCRSRLGLMADSNGGFIGIGLDQWYIISIHISIGNVDCVKVKGTV